MSKNGGCRWWKVKEEEIEPGGRRWWRATVADWCWRWRTTKTDSGGGRRSQIGVAGGGRRKLTVLFVEEEWQRLAVEDGENSGVRGGRMAATGGRGWRKQWCSWRKNGSDWRGGGGRRKQTVVFVEEERHDGSFEVADACCLYFLGFQIECV